jgi:acetyltransferase-like isoleucine patch superfamily enzyme
MLNAQLRLRRAARAPFGVRLQGRAVIGGGGRILLGRSVVLMGHVVPVEILARRGGTVAIGDQTVINYGVSISAHESVTIGRQCHIGHYVFIYDNDQHDIENKFMLPPSRAVVIEDRAWLGTRAMVLKGVRIGHDAVVGAGSIVTQDIPPRSIAVGSPARVVRRF